MDLRMPVMNGFETAKAIRALNRSDAKSIPIVAMTADAFDEDAKRCLDAGMNAHIAKPIEPVKLFQTLLTYIR
jgi:CheY-like chemotaxis protein